MEIVALGENSIKIKAKGANLVVEPEGKAEADAVLLIEPNGEYQLDKVESKRVVIAGPGEFEVGGVHIRCKSFKDGLIYEVRDENFRVVLLSSTALQQALGGEEEYSAVIIKVVGKISDETLSTILSGSLPILYGNIEGITTDPGTVRKLPRVSLKKKEEVKGSIVYLSV